jgi:predicted flap endonuclease-1-like 5' DNA nuclease
MVYDIARFAVWLVAALLVGCATGWLTWSRARPGGWFDGWLKWAAAAFVLGLLVAVFDILPERPGFWLELALLFFAFYIAGCFVGGWLKAASTARPDAGPRFAATTAGAALPSNGSSAYDPSVDRRARIVADPATRALTNAGSTWSRDPYPMGDDDRAANEAEAARRAAFAAKAEADRRAAEAAAQAKKEAERQAAAAKAEADRKAAEAQAEAKAKADADAAAQKAAAESAGAASQSSSPKSGELSGASAGGGAQLSQSEDARANGVKPETSAGSSGPDDNLKLIKGIGPKNEKALKELGVRSFGQIADWSAENAVWVGRHMAFPGRIEREQWIEQAKLLAAGVDTPHSAGVKTGAIVIDETSDAALSDAEAAAFAASLPKTMAPVEGEEAHAGARPLGLADPRGGKADDLKLIKGIGKQNEARLHALGVWHFDQIAAWTAANVKWAGSYLAFPGRIDREEWVVQAKELAAGGKTEFAKRVAAGLVKTSVDDGSLGQNNIEGVKPRA